MDPFKGVFLWIYPNVTSVFKKIPDDLIATSPWKLFPFIPFQNDLHPDKQMYPYKTTLISQEVFILSFLIQKIMLLPEE